MSKLELEKEISWETFHGLDQHIKNRTKKLPVLWISAQDCTGCKESFIRSIYPTISETLLEFVSLEYSELLSVASGDYAEGHKETILEEYKEQYVLVIEGSIPLLSDYLMIGGKSVKDEIITAAKHAKAVLAFGSCSSWGGIAAAYPNPTEALPVTELLKESDTPIALIPGCPPIAEVMVGTLLHLHFHDCLPELDKKGRPKSFYQYTVHQQCHRKSAFDQKLFAESFDDAMKDYCLFKLGCKGPSTFNACESIGWNGETCSPISAGSICIGCSEKGFWDKGTLCSRKTRA